MTTEKVNDLELVKLSDYFTPGKFRTIPGTAMTDRGGITEMQAVFNINTDFAKRLTFQFSTMQSTTSVRSIPTSSHARQSSSAITLKQRWVSVFKESCLQDIVMVLELSDAPDKLLAVTADDVEYLLNNCLHPAT